MNVEKFINNNYFPKPGDEVFICTNSGQEIKAKIINWGVENFNKHWVVCESNDSIVTVNIESIESFSIIKTKEPTKFEPQQIERKNSLFVKGSEYDPKSFLKNVNEVDRRYINNNANLTEEAAGIHNKNNLDPVERAKRLAEEHTKDMQNVQEELRRKMHNTKLKKVNVNYGMPSFKNNPKK